MPSLTSASVFPLKILLPQWLNSTSLGGQSSVNSISSRKVLLLMWTIQFKLSRIATSSTKFLSLNKGRLIFQWSWILNLNYFQLTLRTLNNLTYKFQFRTSSLQDQDYDSYSTSSSCLMSPFTLLMIRFRLLFFSSSQAIKQFYCAKSRTSLSSNLWRESYQTYVFFQQPL